MTTVCLLALRDRKANLNVEFNLKFVYTNTEFATRSTNPYLTLTREELEYCGCFN